MQFLMLPCLVVKVALPAGETNEPKNSIPFGTEARPVSDRSGHCRGGKVLRNHF